MGQFPLTLSRFITQSQATHPGITGEFSSLLAQIGLVGKLIAQDLRRAGLISILGTTGEINVQGETVKKLDKIANEIFLKVSAGEAARLRAQGFDFYDWGPGEIRLVTSWDQDAQGVEQLAAALVAL